MSRFARTLLFALVAFWLPATLHCRLEAAGLFESHTGCSGEAATHDHAEHTEHAADECADTICPTVESALYKESAADVKIFAPACHDGLLLLGALLNFSAGDPVSTLSPDRFPPPLELAATWQFSTRAALPVRAPGLNS